MKFNDDTQRIEISKDEPSFQLASSILSNNLPAKNHKKSSENICSFSKTQLSQLITHLCSDNDGSIEQLFFLSELLIIQFQIENPKDFNRRAELIEIKNQLKNISYAILDIPANPKKLKTNKNSYEMCHDLLAVISNILLEEAKKLDSSNDNIESLIVENFNKLDTTKNQNTPQNPPDKSKKNLFTGFSTFNSSPKNPPLISPQANEPKIDPSFALHFKKEDVAILEWVSPSFLSFLEETTLTYLKPGKVKKPGLLSSTVWNLSHTLIRGTEKEWYVIESSIVGKGAFGSVTPCKFKIVPHDSKNPIQPVDQVAKIQKLDADTKKEQKEAIHNEVKLLSEHKIKINAYYETEHEVYMAMDHCGTSFDKGLSDLLKNQATTFEQRLVLSLGILNELQNLKNHNIIHRDIKPANTCYKKIHEQFQIIFIDFGIARKSNKIEGTSGTPIYMAPELLDRDNPLEASFSSDVYSVTALLAEIWGATNVLKNKKGSLTSVAKAKFCLKDLFHGFDVSHVDAVLLQDIKNVLECMQHSDPTTRPTVEFLVKFFNSIPNRLMAYQESWENLAQGYNRLTSNLKQIGLSKAISNYENLKDQPFIPLLEKNPNHFGYSFANSIRQQYLQLCNHLKAELKAQSHYQIIQSLINKNEPISNYTEQNPFAPHQQLGNRISILNDLLETITKTLNLFENNFVARNKFNGTNSDGILQIQNILAAKNLPLLTKLEKIQKIAKNRTTGFRNFWSNSHLISRKGRHENIHKLYQRLAQLELTDQPAPFTDHFSKIIDFIEKNDFVHSNQNSNAAATSSKLVN